ncbi:MAG TPA: SDR family NAD(P)-dependent oxidoreductase [Galbitalea sp.]|jgi:NAD(P)-dependent dehydrogenase (short-subunit alcohol dehydrogenase family)|nr:SDR family NAD(P)-dependent oxidoreductase [Galbitalea sp.]
MSKITTSYTWQTTAAEVVRGIELAGKRAIVTGGASGIGVETARALAGAGADVTIAVRDTAAGNRVAEELNATGAKGSVSVGRLDLADRASVADFVAGWSGPLDILVNNAGVMANPLHRTVEGWESQFATNHLGHLNLALGLHDALAAAGTARIVAVSSAAHLRGGVDFDDINFDRREYDPWVAYSQSKTANVLFAVEATRRWAAEGITANALNPGGIMTNLQRHQSEEQLTAMEARRVQSNVEWKTPEQGAATSVFVATSWLLDGVGGRYFDDANEAELAAPPKPGGVAAYALDPVDAERLWDVSIGMIRS